MRTGAAPQRRFRSRQPLSSMIGCGWVPWRSQPQSHTRQSDTISLGTVKRSPGSASNYANLDDGSSTPLPAVSPYLSILSDSLDWRPQSEANIYRAAHRLGREHRNILQI